MGAAQGIIFSIVLLFVRKGRRTSNYLLSGLIGCIAITMGRHVLRDMHILDHYPLLESVPLTYLLLIGPLLYLYTKSVCTPNYKFDYHSGKHLLPAFVFFIGRIINLIDQILIGAGIFQIFDGFGKLEVIIGVISMSIYAIITYIEIKNTDEISDSDVQNRIWMKKILVGWGIGWVMFATLSLIDLAFFSYSRPYSDYYILFLYLAFVIYWLGLKGFYEMVTHSHKIEAKVNVSALIERDEVKENLIEGKGVTLNEEMSFLTKIMQDEKPYLNPELNLEKLADKVGFSSKKLSTLLNQGFNKSFYQYINAYRVQEFKGRLAKAENQHLTLLAIAFDSGFNSKSTFNYIFKKETGQTPLQLKKKLHINAV